PVEVPAVKEEIADGAAGEHTDDAGDPDDQQDERADDLRDAVLLRDELDPEGLNAGEEVVAARTRNDERDVRLDREDVARGGDEVHLPWVSSEEELRIRLDSAFSREMLRVGDLGLILIPLSIRPLDSLRLEKGLAAADGLAKVEHEPGENKGRQRKDCECGAPGQRGDPAAHGEPDRCAHELPRDDVAVDAAALGRREPVADERGDDRSGGGGHATQEDAREQEPVE